MSLILVRHGLTSWNEEGRLLGRHPIGLNERGCAQAERVAKALRGLSVVAVYSSPQRRTLETAGPIGEALGVEVKAEPALDEVWLGAWKGKLAEELRGDPDLENYIADPTYVCDAIEPAAEVEKRVVDFVEKLRADNDEGRFVLVSHGDPLRLLLAHYMSVGIEGFRRLEIDNGSVSILHMTRRGPRLIMLNWTDEPGALSKWL